MAPQCPLACCKVSGRILLRRRLNAPMHAVLLSTRTPLLYFHLTHWGTLMLCRASTPSLCYLCERLRQRVQVRVCPWSSRGGHSVSLLLFSNGAARPDVPCMRLPFRTLTPLSYMNIVVLLRLLLLACCSSLRHRPSMNPAIRIWWQRQIFVVLYTYYIQARAANRLNVTDARNGTCRV